LTDKAGRTVTIEHRGGEKVELQLSSNLTEDTQNNVDVFPGDTIIVSRAGIVYVVGDVQHPSGFMMEDSAISVLKALALAGGSTRTSALNKTKILRQTPTGIQEIPVDLKKVLYAKAPDVAMVKGDVLFIREAAPRLRPIARRTQRCRYPPPWRWLRLILRVRVLRARALGAR